jgi:hypothetical protein
MSEDLAVTVFRSSQGQDLVSDLFSSNCRNKMQKGHEIIFKVHGKKKIHL